MKRLIDEYGLAILYAIIGAFCLVLFGMIFLGDNTKISSVVTNVVDNSTNNNLNVIYKVNYDLAGGTINLAGNQPYGTLIIDGTACNAASCKVSDINKIKIETEEKDEEGNTVYIEGNPDDSGAKYYLTANNEKLWVTYTRDKSYSIPQPAEKFEGLTKLWFDGWTGSNLSQKTRTLVIPKGSTGNRTYVANWTRGKYRIVYDSNISYLKTRVSPNYKAIVDSGYNIESWLSGTMSDQMVEYGTYPSISANGYSLLGHVFVGWCQDSFACSEPDKFFKAGVSTNTDLAPVLNSENDTVKTVTMYAQWEPIVYKINYVNDQEGVVNTNRSSYTILDQFELEPAQLPDWSGGEWYTVNPYTESYSENNIGWCKFDKTATTIDEKIASAKDCQKTDYTQVEDTRSKYLFGTYSFANFADKAQLPQYLFKNFNKITDSERIKYSTTANKENNVTEIGIKADGEKYTLVPVGNGNINWMPQQISYGTYGDITLYSYLDKYYDLAFIFDYVDWKYSDKKNTQVWTPTKTEQELAGVYRIKNGSPAPTKAEMKDIINKIDNYVKGADNVEGYTFKGFLTEKERKLFNTDATPYEQATEFWSTGKTTDESNNTTIKTVYWTYSGGENVIKVFAGWEPLTYLIKLHSNY